MSETISAPTLSYGKLADALAKAQSKIKAPTKNREVDFTDKNGRRVRYNYADLADVIEAVREPLSSNGLAIVHELRHEGNNFGLKTTLMHSSGELISTWYPLPTPLNVRAQEFGSALTYARRYSLSSLVGIASEEDDDGAGAPDPEPKLKNVVSGKPYNPPKVITKPPPVQKPIADADAEPPPIDSDEPLPNHDDEPKSLLDYLYQLAEERNLPNEEMKKIITEVVGKPKPSVELNNRELQKVIEYLDKKFSMMK